jgi:hypothetical protein
MSTCLSGESVWQKPITGTFTKEESLIGLWSVRGSVTINNLGSMNLS